MQVHLWKKKTKEQNPQMRKYNRSKKILHFISQAISSTEMRWKETQNKEN